jgi:hypothetical protein
MRLMPTQAPDPDRRYDALPQQPQSTAVCIHPPPAMGTYSTVELTGGLNIPMKVMQTIGCLHRRHIQRKTQGTLQRFFEPLPYLVLGSTRMLKVQRTLRHLHRLLRLLRHESLQHPHQ